MTATRNQVISLYRSMLRESRKFSEYNYRNYALRRIRDSFRQNKSVSDANEIAAQIAEAVKCLDVIKRQVVIGSLYSADKLVIENVKHTATK